MRAMFSAMPWQRNRAALLACALAFFSGCGAQLLLRMERQDLDERLLLFLGGGGNSVVFLDGSRAFVTDTKFGPMARSFRGDVERELGRRVQRLLLTHWHLDHTGGLGLYRDVNAVIVHPTTRARLEAKGLTASWVEVREGIELFIGGERVQIRYLGPGHTDGDLVALFVQRRVLVAGDLLNDGFEPNVDVTSGGEIIALRETLERLLALPFDTAVPGHGDLMTRAQVEQVRNYLVALEGAVRRVKDRGASEDEAVKTAAVSSEFDGLKPMPFGPNREKNIRLMYRALEARADHSP